MRRDDGFAPSFKRSKSAKDLGVQSICLFSSRFCKRQLFERERVKGTFGPKQTFLFSWSLDTSSNQNVRDRERKREGLLKGFQSAERERERKVRDAQKRYISFGS